MRFRVVPAVRLVWWLILLLWIASVSSACTPPVTEGEHSQQRREAVRMHRLEKLLALAASDEDLRVTVTSTGCTQARDFAVETAVVDGVCHVRIVRIRPDRCRRAPYPVTLTLSWGAAARFPMEKRVVTNPVMAPDKRIVDR